MNKKYNKKFFINRNDNLEIMNDINHALDTGRELQLEITYNPLANLGEFPYWNAFDNIHTLVNYTSCDNHLAEFLINKYAHEPTGIITINVDANLHIISYNINTHSNTFKQIPCEQTI